MYLAVFFHTKDGLDWIGLNVGYWRRHYSKALFGLVEKDHFYHFLERITGVLCPCFFFVNSSAAKKKTTFVEEVVARHPPV